MPAYFESGFSVRKPMWHGMGVVLDEYPETWADARKAAGLEWEPVLLSPSTAFDPDGNEYDLVGSRTRLVYRSDRLGSPEGELGRVTDEYVPFHNAEIGTILEAFHEADKKVKFETAGAVGENGHKVYALAYLDEPIVVAGDDSETLPFLALLTDHSGGSSVHVVNTMVRVVCWNTYHAALAEGKQSGRMVSFRHVGDITEHIDRAKAAVKGLRVEIAAWQNVAAELYGIGVSDEQFNHFMEAWLPLPPALPKLSTKEEHEQRDRQIVQVEKGRKIFKSLYLDSSTCAAHRGTGLGVLDAATEYLDHARPRRAGTFAALDAHLFGGDPQKVKATKLIQRLA